MRAPVWIVLATILLSACASKTPRPDDPQFAPVSPQQMYPPKESNGSIFQDGYEMSLYGDRRAHRVGDILVVVLEETTNSQKSATAADSKTTSVSVQNPTILGVPLSVNGRGIDTSIGGTNTFSGSGSAKQSNKLSGTIAVTVSEVLPNGVLRVRGEKWINLTQGEEFVRLTGLVRPQDVNPDNEVSSTRVADARIAYSGTGQAQDSVAQGWLTKFFFSALWPF